MLRFVRLIVLRPWLRRAALALVLLLALRAVWIVGHVVWWRFQDVGETAFMKDRLDDLEVYVNVIEWGDGVFGAEAAARHYFGVSASALTPEQAAWLAAIIPSPRRYDRNRDNAKVRSKAARIRAQMDALELP